MDVSIFPNDFNELDEIDHLVHPGSRDGRGAELFR